eukprot:CAMPEP_0119112828 /NCGR_PEP_ID=MMETSP1180-20130426/41844_1 /TAXON_ID=3052 ORGANISM="Chlamydomonas cf sp, Strain CCMP681" /NCGR_SAMPLE_ID=MMETSP1180 /ASSEMBLY_ACC=CAM_ASM_000741 /LENGTH=123 /DNA_ID=CAMNT_0007100551 /DNA_START=8 /DNA_END=375 /DNA_ORIENTATION=-
MVPLEVTHSVLCSDSVLERVRGPAPSSPFRVMLGQLLTYFKDTYELIFRFTSGPPLHDPCAAAYIIAPHLFKVEPMRVDVEHKSSLTYGTTVCDVWKQSGQPPNCSVALSVDVEGFWDLMLAA